MNFVDEDLYEVSKRIGLIAKKVEQLERTAVERAILKKRQLLRDAEEFM